MRRLPSQPSSYDAGIVNGDCQVHAIERLGGIRYSLCRNGAVAMSVPAPFDPSYADACPRCATSRRSNNDLEPTPARTRRER
jgi:hypothetical protein